MRSTAGLFRSAASVWTWVAPSATEGCYVKHVFPTGDIGRRKAVLIFQFDKRRLSALIVGVDGALVAAVIGLHCDRLPAVQGAADLKRGLEPGARVVGIARLFELDGIEFGAQVRYAPGTGLLGLKRCWTRLSVAMDSWSESDRGVA